MVTKESTLTITARENILDEIRDAIARTGTGTLSMKQFRVISGIKWRGFFKHFQSWAEALSVAGFACKPGGTRIDPTLLMEDCARIARQLGRMPSRREYDALGNFNETTLSKSCGCWGNVALALRAFAAQRREWSDLLDFLPAAHLPARRIRRRILARTAVVAQKNKMDSAAISIPCGAPLDFGPLRHEPTNEQGVIFLFGIMAEKLGFLIEAFQSSAFPDCKAKRLDSLPPMSRSPRWRDVKIEFEYESRNFRSHAHDPQACDLIVCWTHNWKECPLEVIALKDEINRL